MRPRVCRPTVRTVTVADEQLADFPELHRARQLWGANKLDAALEAFEAAIRARPSNLKALLEAARAFGGRHEIARAERLLDEASRLSGGDARVTPIIAQTYARAFRPHRAIELYQELAAQHGGLPPVMQGELAGLLEQLGRLEDALVAIDACIAQARGAPEPKLVRARILRRLGRNVDATAALRPLAELRDHPAVAAEAWTELCYVQDRAGEYEQAAASIARAHQIVLGMPQAPTLLQRAEANNIALGRLAESLSAEDFERWAGATFDVDPRCSGIAHLIGFPRSGTTLLEQCLDGHPDLADSPERVVFARDIFPRLCRAGGGPLTLATLDAIPHHAIAAERIRYVDFMAAALGESLGGRVHLDKNPNHTSLLPGLFRLFPESRFIVALRDPRDVVASCVLRTFQLTEFSAMLLTWESACRMYAFEMGTWLRYRELLPEGSWVEIRYEDTVSDMEAATRRALGVLELPWDGSVLRYRERTRDKHVNSPTQTEVRQPVYTRSVGRWRHYAEHLEPHLDVLRPYLDAFGYTEG